MSRDVSGLEDYRALWKTMSAEDNDRMEAALLKWVDEDEAMSAIQVMMEHSVPNAAYREAVEENERQAEEIARLRSEVIRLTTGG